MRWLAVAAAVLGLAACGGDGGRAAADPCAGAGFAGGSSAADGVFFAVVPAGCATAYERTCEVGDGTSWLTRVAVPPRVEQSCVAFNQFVGSGLNQVAGLLAGECFGRARTAAAPVLADRTQLAPRACRRRGPRLPGDGEPRARLDPARARTAVVARLRVPDPYGVAPEAGAVGERRTGDAPPWTVLTWRSRAGDACYAAGQVVDRDTPGRADQLPGVRPTGEGLTGVLVGSLRYDSRSGTGIQLYGLGRFTPWPVEEGGACGAPARGAGLLVQTEQRRARPDATLGHTIVAGIAGPAVRSIRVGGVPVAIDRATRAFVRVVRGEVDPARLPVAVRR